MNCGISTSPALAILAQDKLLRHFLKRTSFEVRSSPSHDLNYVVFRAKNRSNQVDNIHHKPSTPKIPRTLVLMHGYGSGLGFFHDNYDSLAQNFDRVIAVDWLGMGCSSRTSKRITKVSLLKQLTGCGDNKEEHERDIAKQVADEFIDSLEELRAHEGIEDFVLAGHSLGGFLAAKYAVKYPKHVKGLALISPVGVPEMPPQELRITDDQLHWRIRFFKNLWSWNFTPQAIVRVAGSRGPDLVNNAIIRRFSPNRWNPTELKLISDYMYHITAAPGNGEYALNALLQPVFSQVPEDEQQQQQQTLTKRRSPHTASVYAKLPVEKELATLRCPILLIYGDNDWLYYPTAKDSVALWQRHGIPADLRIIDNAGHHLYLDNSETFNNTLIQWSLQLLR